MDKKSSILWLAKPYQESDLGRETAGEKRLWSRKLLWFGMGLLPVVLAAVFVSSLWGHAQDSQHLPRANGTLQRVKSASSATWTNATSTIEVDVHGDVVHPGVVQVPSTARVQDVIQAAGGFRHPSDTKNVNQAALVWDGEELDVLSGGDSLRNTSAKQSGTLGQSAFKPQSNAVSTASVSAGRQGSGRINLNSADTATLETVPGIGPGRAFEIIQYRTLHGPFKQVRDLLNVKGIGTKMLADWQPYLYVDSSLQAQ